MPSFNIEYASTVADGESFSTTTEKEFTSFTTSALGIGDVGAQGSYRDALAAIFDLEGFTTFCNQIDPYLAVPDYLDAFLAWLFEAIRTEALYKKQGERVALYCRLPFFTKFLGDGVLLLWDTHQVDPSALGNMVVSLRNIQKLYVKKFLPGLATEVTHPPKKLRCGVARGQVVSLGDGHDFVGPCINVAARLQKLGNLSFAFSRRGFSIAKCFNEASAANYILVKAPIRGVGEEELVFVVKAEYEKLSPSEQKRLPLAAPK